MQDSYREALLVLKSRAQILAEAETTKGHATEPIDWGAALTFDEDDLAASSYRDQLQMTPEVKLGCNIIHRAVLDYVTSSEHGTDSECWLFFGKSENSVGSLLWWCDHISERPDDLVRVVRAGALQIREMREAA